MRTIYDEIVAANAKEPVHRPKAGRPTSRTDELKIQLAIKLPPKMVAWMRTRPCKPRELISLAIAGTNDYDLEWLAEGAVVGSGGSRRTMSPELKKIHLNISMPPKDAEWLREKSLALGVSVGVVVTNLVARYYGI